MSPSRVLLVTIQTNRETCGSCRFLRAVDREFWVCDLWQDSKGLGLVGAQKTPNRLNKCIEAEEAAEDL